MARIAEPTNNPRIETKPLISQEPSKHKKQTNSISKKKSKATTVKMQKITSSDQPHMVSKTYEKSLPVPIRELSSDNMSEIQSSEPIILSVQEVTMPDYCVYEDTAESSSNLAEEHDQTFIHDSLELDQPEAEILQDVALDGYSLSDLPFLPHQLGSPELVSPENFSEISADIQDNLLEPETIPITVQLTEHIQTLEPVVAEEASMILVVVSEKILEIQELAIKNGDAEQILQLEDELKVLCTRLLVCMGVEVTPERVSYLVSQLTLEFQEQNSAVEKQEYDTGTHEKKKGVSWLMNSLDDIRHPSPNLGRYALQLVAPTTVLLAA